MFEPRCLVLLKHWNGKLMPLLINILHVVGIELQHVPELYISYVSWRYTFYDKVIKCLSLLVKSLHLSIDKLNSLCVDPSCTILDSSTTLIRSLLLVNSPEQVPWQPPR